MAVENLAVIISGRSGDLVREFRRVAHEADDSSSKTHRAWSRAGKGVALAGAGIAGAVLAIGASSIKAAVEGEESHARMVNAFKNAGVNADVFAEKVDRLSGRFAKLGYENDELESAVATLARALHDPAKAISEMGLAADIARGRNISLADATNILVKVGTGHVGLLGRMGIATKDATGKTISQTEAIKKLTQMYAGQATAASDTFAGKSRALAAEFKNAQEKLGQKLLPALVLLATFLTDKVIPAIEATVAWVQEHWPQISTTISETVDNISNTLRPWVETILSLWDRFGSTIVRFVVTTFKSVKQMIQGALNVIMGVIRLFLDLVQGKWGKLWDDVRQIVKGAMQFVRGFLGQVLNQITTILSLAWQAIRDKVADVWNGIVDYFKKLPGRFADAIRATPGLIFGIMAQIPGKVLSLAGQFLSAGLACGAAIVAGIRNGIVGAANFAGSIADAVWNGIRDAWNAIARRVNDFIQNDLGWGPFSIDLPDNPIPTFARGGIVTRPTLAIIGEAGPEAVVPLSRFSAAHGSTVVNHHVTVNVSGLVHGHPHDMGRAITDALDAYMRRSGKRWLAVGSP